MKKYRAVSETYQRVYYEAIFEAEDDDDADRMITDGLVTWNETNSKLDESNETFEEIKDE